MIESWVMSLKEKTGRTGNPLSHITINHCLTCLKIMFKEAVRLEYLNKSPAVSIVQLRENPKEKDILNINEVKDHLQRKWLPFGSESTFPE